MTTHDRITALLHEGLSDRAIARQLHTDAKKVAATRRQLGIAKAKSGYKARPAAELFQARTEPLPGGHLRWTGHVNNTGVPAVRVDGRLVSAYRLAFRPHTGRDPVGRAAAGCGVTGCVAPAHIDDQPARDRNRIAYKALFGGTP